MEGLLTATEKQSRVASFLEIAVGQTAETARQFLQATSWQLEEAIQLFLIGTEVGGGSVPPAASLPDDAANSPDGEDDSDDNETDGRIEDAVQDVGVQDIGVQDVGEDGVRPPLPVKREILYDDAAMFPMARMGYSPHEAASMIAFRNFQEESRRPDVWVSDQGASSTAEDARDNLASLYRPPFALMYRGPFEQAKVEASTQGKWLLVNLQSPKEFSSHMLNRDTWANEAVAQTVKSNFIFWQVYDDTSEGRKVCTYYNLYSIPVILVIDPITGQKMRSWNGMVEPERLLEDLLPFMDKGPRDHVGLPHKRPRENSQAPLQKILDDSTEDEELLRALAVSMEQHPRDGVSSDHQKEGNCQSKEQVDEVKKEEITAIKKMAYPPLPEEPKGDRSLLCRVGVRLPNGRRLQRNFLRSDTIQLLWSFCHSQLKEEERNQPFRLTEAIPGASRTLDFDSNQTFEEANLSNAMLSLAWE